MTSFGSPVSIEISSAVSGAIKCSGATGFRPGGRVAAGTAGSMSSPSRGSPSRPRVCGSGSATAKLEEIAKESEGQLNDAVGMEVDLVMRFTSPQNGRVLKILTAVEARAPECSDRDPRAGIWNRGSQAHLSPSRGARSSGTMWHSQPFTSHTLDHVQRDAPAASDGNTGK
jgi:hypothetical protein